MSSEWPAFIPGAIGGSVIGLFFGMYAVHKSWVEKPYVDDYQQTESRIIQCELNLPRTQTCKVVWEYKLEVTGNE